MSETTSTIIRAITSDGSARIAFINSTEIVKTACRTHSLSKTMTATLGRALTVSSLMGSFLKNKTDSLTLRIDGNGPAGLIVCVSDYKGNVRGYAENPFAELPPKENGKLNVGGSVGEGTLYVVKDLGMAEPYIGMSPIVSGEIAEDITEYFANSEQTPTACVLGVRVDKNNMCYAAGGFLLQLLPGADDEIAIKAENNIRLMAPISDLIAGGKSGEEIIQGVFNGIDFEMFDEFDAEYYCPCNREKYLQAIASLSATDLDDLMKDDEPIITNCRFCDKKYSFTNEEILKELNDRKNNL